MADAHPQRNESFCRRHLYLMHFILMVQFISTVHAIDAADMESDHAVERREDDGEVVSRSSAFRPGEQEQSQPALPFTFDTNYAPPAGGKLWTVRAGENLQAALDGAQPGDIVELESGATFTGRFKIKRRPMTRDDWIYVRGSRHDELPPPGTRVSRADAALMPKIVSVGTGANGTALEILARTRRVRLVGLEITTTHDSRNGTATNLVLMGHDEDDQRSRAAEQLPSNIVFDRVYIHGTEDGDVRNGILGDGRNVAVIDSVISNIHSTSESHGIVVYDGAGPYKIVNNHLEASGINIMFGGTDPTIDQLVPADIEFRGNHVSKKMAWRGSPWIVKNLFELKNARRVLVDGNVFEYCWLHAQTGYAILMKSTNQGNSAQGAPWSVTEDVTFTNNIVRHASAGFQISGRASGPPAGGQTSRVRIENNLLYDLSSTNWGGDGRAFVLYQDHRDVHLVHNTFITDGKTSVVQLNGSKPAVGMAIEGNIFYKNKYGLAGDSLGEGARAFEHYAPGYSFRNNVIIGANAKVYPAGNYFPATESGVGFVDVPSGDYRLDSDSSYKGIADNSDPGVDLDAVEAATRGALEGIAPNAISLPSNESAEDARTG